ncbi:lanthionine synthetase C family protein [Kutzneria viridogrisea]
MAELAARLSDPDAVHAATTAHGTHVDVAGSPSPVWEPTSLSRGHAAPALLHAELGDKEKAHRFLARAAEDTKTQQPRGAFEGLGALASAVRVAARQPEDYAAMLTRLDEHMAVHARWLVGVQRANRPTAPSVIDVVQGLSGVGRYLLHRGHEAAREVLSCLTELAGDFTWRGVEVPGWWYDCTPTTMIRPGYEDGQVNFGLAHGFPGPLALLAVAWRLGVRVPGQDEAIQRMAEWLVLWREQDTAGSYWTAHIPLSYYLDRDSLVPPPARAAWCYGTPGTARALLLAGRALDRTDLVESAAEAMRAMLARPERQWGITDHSLCHGWAGLLHTVCRFAWDTSDPELAKAADDLAQRLVRDFTPEVPFGYRYWQAAAEVHLDMPGLLEGGVGIALALNAYANGRPPTTEWDTILLLD